MTQHRWKVFTVIYRPTPLLAHFVAHYSRIGFTDIVIAASTLCAGIDWAAIRAAAAPAFVHIEPLYHGIFDNARDSAVLNCMKARWVEDRHEWSSIVDLDEFAELPIPLAEFSLLPPEVNAVQGFFVDHVAADGTLPPIRDDVPLFGQFPIETQITKRILGGYDRKLMLTRSFHALNRGQHSMGDENVHPQAGRIHHFKWNAVVLEHLTERIRTKDLTGYRWTHESERFFEHWQRNGRIVISECL